MMAVIVIIMTILMVWMMVTMILMLKIVKKLVSAAYNSGNENYEDGILGKKANDVDNASNDDDYHERSWMFSMTEM